MILINIIIIIYIMKCEGVMQKCSKSSTCGWCGFCVSTFCKYPFTFISSYFSCFNKNFCRQNICLNDAMCKSGFGYQIPTCICDVKKHYYGKFCQRVNHNNNIKMNQLGTGFGVFFSQLLDKDKFHFTSGVIYQIKIFVTSYHSGEGLRIRVSTSEGFELTLEQDYHTSCGNKDLKLIPLKFDKDCMENSCYHYLPTYCQVVYSGLLDFPYKDFGDNLLKIFGSHGSEEVNGYVSDVTVIAENKIDSENYNFNVFQHTFQVMVDFNNLEGANVSPPPRLIVGNCDKFSKSCPKFSRSQDITFKYIIKFINVLQLEFIVYSMPYLMTTISQVQFNFNLLKFYGEYSIPAYSIKVGKYKLRMIIKGEVSPNIFVSNFEDCYFTIQNLRLVSILEGGSRRLARLEEGIFISGVKSYNPNEPIDNQKDVYFSWTCSPKCNDIILSKGKTMQVLPKDLTLGKTYTFTLTISAPGMDSGFASQEILVVGNKIEGMSIICVANCKEKVIPTDLLLLQVQISICKSEFVKYLSNKSVHNNFNWTYNMPEESDKTFFSVSGLYDESYPSDLLCIKPNSLKPGKVYQFQATNYKYEYARFIVKVDTPPHNGSCTVSPLSGVLAKTLFNITCEGYIYDDQMLLYEYFDKYESEPAENFNGRMLGSDRQGTLLGVTLTRGKVVIFIYNFNGYFAIFIHKIQLDKDKGQFTDYALESNLTEIKTMAATGDLDRTLNCLTNILDIYPDDKNYMNTFSKSIDIVQTDRIVPRTLSEMKIGMLTFRKVISLLPISGSLKLPSSTAKSMIKYLGTLTRVFREEIHRLSFPYIRRPLFNDIANVVINVIETLVTTLNNFQSSIHTKLNGMNSKEFKDLQEIDIYLKRTINDFTYSVSFKQYKLLHYFDLKSKSNISSLVVLTDSCLEAIKKVNENEKFNIKFPKNAFDCFEKDKDIITIQSTAIKGSSFLLQHMNSLSTKIVSVDVFKRLELYNRSKSSMEHLKHFSKPFDLFLDVETTHKHELLSLSITKHNLVGEIDLDATVMVVRIDVPQRCRMFLKFIFQNSSDELQVKVLWQSRPSYEVMQDSSIIINSSYPTYVVPYEISDENLFLYIGMIPSANMVHGKTVNFSIDLFCNTCLTQKEHMWVKNFCIVGGETNDLKVHCQCNHLSLFGAVFLVPPNKLNPFDEIGLLLTIKDNPYIVIFILIITLGLLILCVLAIVIDLKQSTAREIIYLEDNFSEDKYFYIIAIFTGFKLWASTNANVGIEIIGTKGKSRTHILKAKKRRVLRNNTDDWFLIGTSTLLGTVTYVHIWHDNKGFFPDWYCEKILVYDVNSKTVYTFFAHDWISLNSDQYPEAVITPATADEYRSLLRIFVENLKHGIGHSYILSGICSHYREVKMSNLDRVLMLWCVMMTASFIGIAFYKAGHNHHDGIDEPQYSLGTTTFIKGTQIFFINTFFIAFFQVIFKISYHQKEKENYENYKIYEKKQNSSIPVLRASKAFFSVSYRQIKKSNMTSFEKFVQVIYKTYRPMSHMPVVLSTSAPVINRKPVQYTLALMASLLTIILCTFFIILYGLKMGEVMSFSWMTHIGVVIVNHFLLLIPMKIVLVAVILASHFVELVSISDYKIRAESIMNSNLDSNINGVLLMRRNSMYHPLTSADSVLMRNKREKNNRILKTINLLFVLFIIILILVSQSWKVLYFNANKHIEVMITENSDVNRIDFKHVINKTQFMDYLFNTFVYSDTLYRKKWYNMFDLSPLYLQEIATWTNDCTNQLIRFPMLRQLRVIPNTSCTINNLMRNITDECMPMWSKTVQDTDTYGYGWTIKHWKTEDSITPWSYQKRSSSEISYSDSVTGTSYACGGYLAKLGMSRYKTNLVLLRLEDGHWVDRNTRVVFGAFTLYNVNAHLFSHVGFVAEHLLTGMYFTKIQVESLVLSFYQVLSSFVYIIYITILIFKTGVAINNYGIKYFMTKIRYISQIFLIITGILTVVLCVVHMYISTKDISNLKEDSSEGSFNLYKIIKYQSLSQSFSILFFGGLVMRLFMFWPYGKLYSNVISTIKGIAKTVTISAACVAVICVFHWNILANLSALPFLREKCSMKWSVSLTSRKCLEETNVNIVFLFLMGIIYVLVFGTTLFIYKLEKYKPARKMKLLQTI